MKQLSKYIELYRPPHLHLRIQDEADAPDIFALVQSDQQRLSQTLPWPMSVRHQSDTLNTIKHNRQLFAQGTSAVYVIRWDGEIAGITSFNTIDGDEAVIGYWIASVFEGKSVAYNAVSALVDWYAKEGELKTFIIKCSVENPRSNRLAQRLGFYFHHLEPQGEKIGQRFLDQNIYYYSPSDKSAG